ncbi:hypothetical protein LUZ60_008439 [Juncus effusus]|nr:hypothetical protein LUZ60_008439 [Juncus effusus]
MESSQGNSVSLPPFLTKTYEMVDDESTNEIVSWSSNNSSFIVWNPLEFAKDLLPKYFKHNNFSSFVRQLNTYGFHKVDPDLWEFANDDFIKGDRNRLKNIHRRKPIFSHSSQTGPGRGPLSETERNELEGEIDRLKLGKNSLISELSQQAETKQQMDLHMQSLEEKLQVLEERQKGLIEYLSSVVNKPGFISNILRRNDHVSKKRRADLGEIPILPLPVEPFERMESSLNSLESFFRGASEAFGQEDLHYDRIAPTNNSTVILTELNPSSEETDLHSRADSPAIHIPEILPAIDDNNSSKVKEIDMNSEPKIQETESGTENREMESGIENRELESGKENRNRNSGQNDVFWEQFLTEHPGGNNEVEVQSERREEREGSWLDKRNMEGLTEKMVNLSSVGKA